MAEDTRVALMPAWFRSCGPRLRRVLTTIGTLVGLGLSLAVLARVYVALWITGSPSLRATIVGCLAGVTILIGGLMVATGIRTRHR